MSDNDEADLLNEELDSMSDAEADVMFALMKGCGCTLLCYWTEERRAHIRQHIADACRPRETN